MNQTYEPWASSPAAERVMKGNKKRDTRPELALRHAAHSLGLRYRVACRPLAAAPWTADLVFRKARVAVFLDGCFWHGCAEHFSAPRTNMSYWGPKMRRNRARDRIVDSDLRKAGWLPFRVWEHEEASRAALRILRVVRKREGAACRVER